MRNLDKEIEVAENAVKMAWEDCVHLHVRWNTAAEDTYGHELGDIRARACAASLCAVIAFKADEKQAIQTLRGAHDVLAVVVGEGHEVCKALLELERSVDLVQELKMTNFLELHRSSH